MSITHVFAHTPQSPVILFPALDESGDKPKAVSIPIVFGADLAQLTLTISVEKTAKGRLKESAAKEFSHLEKPPQVKQAYHDKLLVVQFDKTFKLSKIVWTATASSVVPYSVISEPGVTYKVLVLLALQVLDQQYQVKGGSYFWDPAVLLMSKFIAASAVAQNGSSAGDTLTVEDVTFEPLPLLERMNAIVDTYQAIQALKLPCSVVMDGLNKSAQKVLSAATVTVESESTDTDTEA